MYFNMYFIKYILKLFIKYKYNTNDKLIYSRLYFINYEL